MSFVLLVFPVPGQAQEPNEICFSIDDSKVLLRTVKEHSLLSEQINLLKQSIEQRDKELGFQEEKVRLLESSLANRDELARAQQEALKDTKQTMDDAKKIIEQQQKEISKAKFWGFVMGGSGIVIAILALLVVL